MSASFQQLAEKAYEYAEAHYGDRNYRFDVVVECMEKSEIAAELEELGVKTEKGAIAWARRLAKGQREQQLNQAWDGPESCEPGYEF